MNTPFVRVSKHATERFTQRVSLQDMAEIFYLYLYLFGRDPTDEELDKLDYKRVPGREYRICWHKSRHYLVVFDPETKTFVTLWKR